LAASGAGTVTSVSVVSANGLAGTVATATTTPAITLSTTVTGILKGDGTAISAATAGVDYLTPSGASTLYVPYTGATGDVDLGVHKITAQNMAVTQYEDFTGITTPSTPSAGFSRLYAQLGVDGIARMSVKSPAGFDLTIFRDSVQRVYNPTGSTITKGSAVYVVGQNTGTPSVNNSKADASATAGVFGVMISDALASAFGTVQIQGLAQNLNTNAFNAGDVLYVDATTAGALTATPPTDPNFVTRVAIVMVKSATVGQLFMDVDTAANLSLDNLNDVIISTPALDQVLRYNGTIWVNGNVGSSSAGVGITFYNATPSIIAAGADNSTQLLTFAKVPVVTAEQTITGTGDSASTPIPYSAWLYDTALGRTSIDGGLWTFASWANISNATGTTTISRVVYAVLDEVGGVTVTVTGTGTSRTATASGGTPFATTKVDVGGTSLTNSYLKTPKGIYQITARASDTAVTITTPAGYTNDSAAAFSVWKKVVYSGESPDINTTTASGNYDTISLTVTAAAYPITVLHKLGAISFVTSTASRVVTTTYNGTTRSSHIDTPLVTLHNNLAGLQGGTGSGVTGEYYHLTAAEYTATGTTGSGNFARLTSPQFTTPNIGSATGSVSGNAGTVTGLSVTGGSVLTVNVTDTAAVLGTAQTYTATQTEKQVIWTNNPITASGNAATVPITFRLHTVTNNSAATLTITMTTASAVDGAFEEVRILDASGAAQTIVWVNTENSTVNVPTTSNGSTTLPLSVLFQFNGGTTKWRCVAVA
jgi:hypothetical protein